MLLVLDDVLDAAALRHMAARLREARWLDGRMTAGHQSARVKRNRQLAEDDPLALELSGEIGAALHRSPRFVSAALPNRISPLLFNAVRITLASAMLAAVYWRQLRTMSRAITIMSSGWLL